MAVKYKLTITRYTETVTRRSFFRYKSNSGEPWWVKNWKTIINRMYSITLVVVYIIMFVLKCKI